MRATGNAAIIDAAKEKTQFQITSDLLRNLYKFNLTPVTKLVLLELTTHLNENKNGSVVFPSVGYIAEVLGIGLTAAKKAINDLIKEGLIIKSKRSKVRGNYNLYLFTPKVRNLTSERSENECFKKSECDLFMITNKKEQNKQQRVNFKVENIPQKYSNKSGGNVYSGDDEILKDYAIKHGARNIEAYITTLKSSKSAEKIICEYKKRKKVTQMALHSVQETQNLLKQYESFRQNVDCPQSVNSWVELGKKFSIQKKL